MSSATNPPGRAEVVVIGGGAIGLSIAFHLAESGIEGVAVVERGELGSGSTSKASGGVRTQFSDPLNVAMSLRSRERFVQFAERPGHEVDFRSVGYLLLVAAEDTVGPLTEDVRAQQEQGLANRVVSPTEAKELSPLIESEGLLVASWSPDDGHATPEALVQGYASGALTHGVRIVTGCTVTGIECADGRISSVVTDKGEIRTGAVICAAGVWSPRIGEQVSVSLPVVAERREVHVTEPIYDLPDRIPMTVDLASGFWFHREGPAVIFGTRDPGVEPGFAVGRSEQYLTALSDAMAARAPRLLDVGLAHGWSGFVEVTPDHNALLGEAAGISRFIYATGFSGHGFMHAPAVGEVVRDLFLGRTPEFDIGDYAVERFDTTVDRGERHFI